jgi:hypothetical protein
MFPENLKEPDGARGRGRVTQPEGIPVFVVLVFSFFSPARITVIVLFRRTQLVRRGIFLVHVDARLEAARAKGRDHPLAGRGRRVLVNQLHGPGVATR